MHMNFSVAFSVGVLSMLLNAPLMALELEPNVALPLTAQYVYTLLAEHTDFTLKDAIENKVAIGGVRIVLNAEKQEVERIAVTFSIAQRLRSSLQHLFAVSIPMYHPELVNVCTDTMTGFCKIKRYSMPAVGRGRKYYYPNKVDLHFPALQDTPFRLNSYDDLISYPYPGSYVAQHLLAQRLSQDVIADPSLLVLSQKSQDMIAYIN